MPKGTSSISLTWSPQRVFGQELLHLLLPPPYSFSLLFNVSLSLFLHYQCDKWTMIHIQWVWTADYFTCLVSLILVTRCSRSCHTARVYSPLGDSCGLIWVSWSWQTKRELLCLHVCDNWCDVCFNNLTECRDTCHFFRVPPCLQNDSSQYRVTSVPHKLLCMYMQVRVPHPLLPLVSVRVPTPRAWFKVNVTFNGNFDGGETTTWHTVCVSIAQSETSWCQRQGVFLSWLYSLGIHWLPVWY